MPLFDTPTPFYINRIRIFIDSDDKDAEQSESNWDGVYHLGAQYTNIQSIELVSYNIPRSIMPTFVETYTNTNGNTVRGNNKLDIRLADVPETRSLTFTVTFAPGRYLNISALTDEIPTLFGDAMDAAGDAFFNTGAGIAFVVFSATSSTNADAPQFKVQVENGGDPTLVSMEYLFGTGTNADQSPWKVFGFPEGQDNGGYQELNDGGGLYAPTILYDPTPSAPASVTPYRYIDVYIKEMPELTPVARIFMADAQTNEGNFTTNQLINNKPRLLQDFPVRKLDTLTIRLEFEDGIMPTVEFEDGYDLIFDMLVLVPEQNIPRWANKQQFAF